jgi:RNA-directed DNA polymerase
LNSAAPWPGPQAAQERVLGIQRKLHRWAEDDQDRRFQDLHNLVCDPATLMVAWQRVRANRGSRSAGVDRQNAYDVERRLGVEQFLGGLREELRAGTFRPAPVKERLIPKRGGKLRRLGIATVRDRVVQAALKLVLEPIFEADFQPCSYGFRPGRRAQDAIAEIHYLTSSPRNYEWIVEADIEACFDRIDHTALMRRVRGRIEDKRVLALIKAFLHAGILTEHGLRVGLAGVGHGPSHLGIAASEVPTAARRLTARRVRLEALAVHLLSVGLDRPLSEVRCMAGELRVRWPHPPEQFAAAARTIASLAVRLDIPAVDVGGGFPPAPDERIYAQKLGGALGAVGFEGRLIVEPGRALVGEAVDLACTVLAVKRLADGGRCVVVDAGTDLVAGALYRWPHLEVVGAKRESAQPALVIGPGTKHLDVLHPAARLPPVEEGDVLLVRRVGAYTSRNRRGSPRRGPRSWRETGAGGGCALVDKRSRAWSPATLAPRSEPEPVSGHFSGSGER